VVPFPGYSAIFCPIPAYLGAKNYLPFMISIQTAYKTKIKADQTKPNQTKPNQTKPNQTKPNQTKPNQIRPNQTKTAKKIFLTTSSICAPRRAKSFERSEAT